MNVPFPFRVAAGVLAVGFDRLRALPEDVPAMAVTLAGHALRTSMRIQQEIAQLATRGEELLAPLTDRPEVHPPWAHFDDEDSDYEVEVVDAADTADMVGAGSDADTDEDSDTAASAGPDTMSDYDELRVTQLRARLQNLNHDGVAALLEYEQDGQARAAYLTTLENRLTTLRSDAGGRTHRKSVS